MKLYINVKDTQLDLEQFTDELRENILDLTGATLLAEVTRRTPIDQGRLQGSWQDGYTKKENTVTLASNIEYARYVEEGTGLYGSNHTLITPNRNYGGKGNVLSWQPTNKMNASYHLAGPDGYVYFKHVKGQKGRHMVRDGINETIRKLPIIIQSAASKTNGVGGIELP